MTMSTVRNCSLSTGCNNVFGRRGSCSSARVVLTECFDGRGAGNNSACVRAIVPGRKGSGLGGLKHNPLFGGS